MASSLNSSSREARMRRVSFTTPSHFLLTKILSVALCFALVGLEAAPVFARSNDDYQLANNSYGSQGGYSPQSFDFQMQRMNAQIQSFVAPPVHFNNYNQFSAPKLNLSYQPPIRFQYVPQVKVAERTSQTVVKLDTFTPAAKPTFLQNVGQMFKGIGAAITTAFKKIGDGIVSLSHKIFGSNQKLEVPVTPQAQDLMGSFKNLKEIAPGLLQTQNGKTQALGQAWEPGSTFKADGKVLRLIEGTAYGPNFGGITRADGANLPIKYAEVAGKVSPVGLDFTLLTKETTLKIQAPVNIEGFGKIMGGDMVFQGMVKTPEGTLGKFQFQGAQVQLDSPMASAVDISSPANLVRATFMAKAAVMQLNSVEIQSKDKHLFIQESKPPVDINQVENQLKSVGVGLGEAQSQFTKVHRDFSNTAVASQILLTNVAKATGQTDVAVFQEPNDLQSLRTEAHSLEALSAKVTQDMAAGNYQEVADVLPDMTVRTEVFKARTDALSTQAEMTKGFFKDVRNLTTDLGTVSQVVDVGDLAGKTPLPMDAVAKGYKRFPAPEKQAFADTATHAQETLVKLTEAGVLDPERALDWAMSLKIAKDKVLGAGPSQLGDRISVAARHPQATIKEATSEAADLYVFNRLSGYAETSPKTMEVVGHAGSFVSKGANLLGKVAALGLVVAFPVTSAVGIGTSVGVDKGLQAVDVNDDLSGFVGIVAGSAAGGLAANGSRVATIEKAWANRIGANKGVAQAVQDFKAGFKDSLQWTQRTVKSEAGHVFFGSTVVDDVSMLPSKTLSRVETQTLNQKPWGKEDPFQFFMRKVEELDVITPPNKAVFFSGEGNLNKANDFAILKGKMTINDTPGGKWLNQFDFMKGDIPLTPAQSFKIWSRLSERYSEAASGEITLFVSGSKPERVFFSREFPTLRNNKKIQTWTYR
jgi:cytochrome c556